MEEIRISASIMALKQTPAEKMLLARICQRAAANNGICTDSNKELGEAVFMHPQTISDLVNRLGQTQWLKISSEQSDVIQRLLTPYSDLTEEYKPITYPLDQLNTYPPNQPISQSLTPPKPFAYPHSSITDNRLLADGKRARLGERICPVTGVDIGRQLNDTRFVNSKRLNQLANRQPHIFLALVKQLCPDQTPNMEWPVELCTRMANRVKQLVYSGQPIAPIVLPRRICPVTGIDISHQSMSYALVTASTLQAMYISNREHFNKIAAQFLTSEELYESMTSQLMTLNIRIRRKADEAGSLLQLLTQPSTNAALKD